MRDWICPEGHGVKIGNFCDECGRRLVPPATPIDKPLEVDELRRCPNCGFPFENYQAKYCPGCGRKLLWVYIDNGD